MVRHQSWIPNPPTSTSTWTLKSFASLSLLSSLWLLPKATPNPTMAVTTVMAAVMADTDTLAAIMDTDTDTMENVALMPLLKPKPNLLLKPMPNLLPKPTLTLMPKPMDIMAVDTVMAEDTVMAVDTVDTDADATTARDLRMLNP
eukprot:04361.XXX_47754_47265_1 [CDS] Oithona nana genome sequencing.